MINYVLLISPSITLLQTVNYHNSKCNYHVLRSPAVRRSSSVRAHGPQTTVFIALSCSSSAPSASKRLLGVKRHLCEWVNECAGTSGVSVHPPAVSPPLSPFNCIFSNDARANKISELIESNLWARRVLRTKCALSGHLSWGRLKSFLFYEFVESLLVCITAVHHCALVQISFSFSFNSEQFKRDLK